MKKEEIIKELAEHDGTILSFPDRGPWGENRYRGNCSGWIQAFLIWKYQVKKLAELFAGSGTGSDVCKNMDIQYIGADLNPNPKRKDIIACNAITDDVPEEFLDADMVFMHPPYGAEIKIPYAGFMYEDPTGELSKSDLGQMPWGLFMNTLNKVVMKYYAALEKGARMSILMGDVRRKGLHSMFTDIVKPGELEQVIIKAQHNTVSGRNGSYGGFKSFVPIEHEYILVIKKPGGYQIVFQYPRDYAVDIRNSTSATWRDILTSVMDKLGEAELADIYHELEGCEKTKTNANWQAKIRQTLQMSKRFKNTGRGRWTIAA